MVSAMVKSAQFENLPAAMAKVEEINNAGLWTDGITEVYCTENEIKEDSGVFLVPVLPGYEQFFPAFKS